MSKRYCIGLALIWTSIFLSAPVLGAGCDKLTDVYICTVVCSPGKQGSGTSVVQNGKEVLFTDENGEASKGVIKDDNKSARAFACGLEVLFNSNCS